MTVSFFREGVLRAQRRGHKDPIPRFVMNGLEFALCATRLRRRSASRTSWWPQWNH
jgi:hypothetical protein